MPIAERQTATILFDVPRRSLQLDLFASPRRRRGAKRGRKPRAERAGFVPHVTRPEHDARHPVHVTMKRVQAAPSFREQVISNAIVGKLRELKSRGVQVIEYSIQHDHLHLMVEGQDAKLLSRKMQLLFSRIALAVNRVVGRRGSLFRDRHHRRDLKTPTETRHALVYIFFNERKHAAADGWINVSALEWLDPHSSAPWSDRWHPEARPPPNMILSACGSGTDSPVSQPRTWLAQRGWLRAGGPIRLHELPRLSP